MRRIACLALLSLAACAASAHAEVRLPALFSDHAVLQQDEPIAVWGWARAGEKVTVSIDAEHTASTATDASGKWRVTLPAMKAAVGPQRLTVRGENTIMVDDVLLGEVWLRAGQSNMEMQLKGLHGQVDHADEEIAAANHPRLRMFVHNDRYDIYAVPAPTAEPLADRPGRWIVCSPETAAQFTAIGYFVGRELQAKTGRAVGLITAAVGGTPIEAWTSLPAQQAKPECQPLLADWEKRLSGYDPAAELSKYDTTKRAWLKARASARGAGEADPKAPAPFKNERVMAPGVLFASSIAPLIPYTLRGVLWYQGERNAAGPFTGLYGQQLRTMIADWRARWGRDDLYFAWVQLANIQKPQRLPSEPNGWGVQVRDGMRRALSVPHTGMAITIDLGGPTAGHPTNKAQFAARLASVVLHDVYGQQSATPYTGPLYRSSTREGNALALSFEHAQSLHAASGELQGFAIAGADQKFVWAEARIDGDRVIVSSPKIRAPEAVRYGWAANPIGNLVNAANLPASPFRTDDGH